MKNFMKKTAFITALSAMLLLAGCTGDPAVTAETTAPTAENTTMAGTTTTTPAPSTETPVSDSPETSTEYYFWEHDNTVSNCDPIDKSLDCEQILLDRAETLTEMMMEYYYPSQETRAYTLGEFEVIEELGSAREVNSDEFKTYSEFKALFSDVIYEQYIDFINFSDSGFRECNGKIYFVDFVSGGPRGSIETWYLGCDIEDDKIIGHFAELHADAGSDEPLVAEYLNDESNYGFYDIIVQNIGGKYVLTNCINSNDYSYHIEHGWLYDSGKADRALITNEKVKPAQIV